MLISVGHRLLNCICNFFVCLTLFHNIITMQVGHSEDPDSVNSYEFVNADEVIRSASMSDQI